MAANQFIIRILAAISAVLLSQAPLYPSGFVINPYAFSAAGGGLTAPTHVVTAQNFGGGAAVVATTITVGAESNKIMLIGIGQGNSTTPQTINSVVWSGNGTPQNATAVSGGTATDGNWDHVACYYLVNPTAQTNGTVTVTLGGTATQLTVNVSLYSGANQTPVIGTPVTGNASNSTATVTVSPSTGQLVWSLCVSDANSAMTLGGTSSPTVRGTSGGLNAGDDTRHAMAETINSGTIQWTWSGGDNGWAMVAFTIEGL